MNAFPPLTSSNSCTPSVFLIEPSISGRIPVAEALKSI